MATLRRCFILNQTTGRLCLQQTRLYTNGVTAYSSLPVTVSVRQGFPVLSIPLPSRRENCDFVVRPYLQTVGNFIEQLKAEDHGIENVSLYTVEGNKIAKSTGMDILLQSDFDLKMNDFKHRVEVPSDLKYPLDGETSLGDVRNMIHKLYSSLNVDKHQLSKELELRGQLEQLRAELAPLQKRQLMIANRSNTRTNIAVWTGLAYMSFSFGFFARLTWWEYSWDIMEPVTFFFTYGTSVAMFAYFVLTRQEYVFPDVQDRIYLNDFYKSSKRQKFDVDKFNHLKDTIAKVEGELSRLHDPLQLNLPTPSPDSPQLKST